MPLSLLAFGVPGLVSAGVVALAAFATNGRAHRADRVGGIAAALGFGAGYQLMSGDAGGWHPADGVSLLPLVAALFGFFTPRFLAGTRPGLRVGARSAAALAWAGTGIAAALIRVETLAVPSARADIAVLACLALATVGATIGALVATAGRTADGLPPIAPRPPMRWADDPEPSPAPAVPPTGAGAAFSAWATGAALLVAVAIVGLVLDGLSPLALVLGLTAMIIGLAAEGLGRFGALGWVLPPLFASAAAFAAV